MARLQLLQQEANMKIAPNPVYKFLDVFKLTSGLFLVVLSLMLVSSAVKAADQTEFQKERAACMDGQSGQDRATCLKELGAARGEAKRGNLTDAPSAYQNNAVARCSVLPPADREDCARRVSGGGAVSGSVKSGGVLRETTTIVTEPQPAPASGMQGQ
jgi:hypothetical protein